MRYQLPLKYVNAVAHAGSIRKAAESLAISSTALNRRILAIEEDLGVAIFERVASGVRLSAAGELFIHQARMHLGDSERLRSQLADLSGERRGHVSIACGQAIMNHFLPQQMVRYRDDHPRVTFSVRVCDRQVAERTLANYSADIAIVLEPERVVEFQPMSRVRQSVYAGFHESHPLAGKSMVRLSECLDFPLVLPTVNNGVRHLLERAALQRGWSLMPSVESDNHALLAQCLNESGAVGFQIPIGISGDSGAQGLVYRQIDDRDIEPGFVHIGQLRGRTLPVAAARFMDRIVSALADT